MRACVRNQNRMQMTSAGNDVIPICMKKNGHNKNKEDETKVHPTLGSPKEPRQVTKSNNEWKRNHPHKRWSSGTRAAHKQDKEERQEQPKRVKVWVGEIATWSIPSGKSLFIQSMMGTGWGQTRSSALHAQPDYHKKTICVWAILVNFPNFSVRRSPLVVFLLWSSRLRSEAEKTIRPLIISRMCLLFCQHTKNHFKTVSSSFEGHFID